MALLCLYSLPASKADLCDHALWSKSPVLAHRAEPERNLTRLKRLGCISALIHDCVCVTLELWSSAALVSLLEPDDIIAFTASLRCSPHIYTRAWAVTHAFKAYCAANCYLCYQQGVCASEFFGFGFTLDELGSVKIYPWSTVLHAGALSSMTAWMQMMRFSWGKLDHYCSFYSGVKGFSKPLT